MKNEYRRLSLSPFKRFVFWMDRVMERSFLGMLFGLLVYFFIIPFIGAIILNLIMRG